MFDNPKKEKFKKAVSKYIEIVILSSAKDPDVLKSSIIKILHFVQNDKKKRTFDAAFFESLTFQIA